MAMEIKAIPTLKGKEAEHFVKAADKACAGSPCCAQKG